MQFLKDPKRFPATNPNMPSSKKRKKGKKEKSTYFPYQIAAATTTTTTTTTLMAYGSLSGLGHFFPVS
jgi:hypothetical protein